MPSDSGVQKLSEKDFRLKIKVLFEELNRQFENVDPDIAEVEESQGTVTVILKKGRVIFSVQPSISQLWVAVAFKGIAAHFNWDASKNDWIEDKAPHRALKIFLKEVDPAF